MKNSNKSKSVIQGIADLSFDQIKMLNLEADRIDRITKRILIFGIGIFIALISFCYTFGYFGTF